MTFIVQTKNRQYKIEKRMVEKKTKKTETTKREKKKDPLPDSRVVSFVMFFYIHLYNMMFHCTSAFKYSNNSYL